jgi:hypothetical protein
MLNAHFHFAAGIFIINKLTQSIDEIKKTSKEYFCIEA